jgi:3D (Asp-Asp-Asp) domain-containing protein
MSIINKIKNSVISIGKTPFISSLFAIAAVVICLLGIAIPETTTADAITVTDASYVAKEAQKATKTINVVITAYSSTPDQTDDTPFITASGKHVADGIIANNMLPFGTQVKIPELFGDKIFTVQDRMNKRMSNYQFDVWMPDRASALKFGVKEVEMEVLES